MNPHNSRKKEEKIYIALEIFQFQKHLKFESILIFSKQFFFAFQYFKIVKKRHFLEFIVHCLVSRFHQQSENKEFHTGLCLYINSIRKKVE